jgi:hypothetical protein
MSEYTDSKNAESFFPEREYFWDRYPFKLGITRQK